MPLKHATETFLVLVLGVVIAFTGVVATTLPPLPLGLIPWSLIFAMTLVYPLILSPLFKKRRADYPFRLLHWVPVGMLLVWLGLAFLSQSDESAEPLIQWYTWGWMLPVVTMGFLLLAAFCLHVIRRRVPRLILLLLAFVPFAVGGVMSEQKYHWEEDLAVFVWQGDWWKVEYPESLFPGNTQQVAQSDSASSQQKEEVQDDVDGREKVIKRLRSEERRRERIAARRARTEEDVAAVVEEAIKEVTVVHSGTIVPPVVEDGDAKAEPVIEQPETEDSVSSEPIIVAVQPSEDESSSSEQKAESSSSSSKAVVAVKTAEIREARTLPARLPQSGGGVGILGLFLLAGYFGTLHQRARKRLL